MIPITTVPMENTILKRKKSPNPLKETQNKINKADHSLYSMSIKNNHKQPIKVSIIMPTYNKYHQTSLSLYGLSKQTFPHAQYEVILVDDASSDNTPNLLKKLMSRSNLSISA